MKDLRPVKGKYYIDSLISEGEHEHQDFKFAINDALKIARSISAFANNDGGRLLIGVKDNGRIAGVRNEEDIFVVEQAAEMYCRPAQALHFTSFATDYGIVIRAEIDKAASRPVRAREPDGRWRAYYRVADENIVASPLMVRSWLRAADDSGTILTLSESESALLEALRRYDTISVRDLAIATHLSRASTEDMVVRLSAIGIIEFHHVHGGEFHLRISQNH
ncbi:MAG: ATP-binding protein [Muribaculaceae bacterium]|nr:ATP-binding protein [Muribaculaceae bacterium]